MKKQLYLGIDIGSVSIKTVVIDQNINILVCTYTRHNGLAALTLENELNTLFQKYGVDNFSYTGVTGSGGKEIASILGACFVNEIIAFHWAIKKYYPEVRTLIDIGGEDSKLLLLRKDDDLDTVVLEDFVMNTLCAAGTGSFLDQQARRLNISIEEEFATLALQSISPARIAGRCSVFAKSDMIHLQQKATPVKDILAGLCYAIVRNFKSTIGKGKVFSSPIAIQGGVASNQGIIKAFEDTLEIEKGSLIIPKYFKVMGAIGAALFSLEKPAKITLGNYKSILEYLKKNNTKEKSFLPLTTGGNGSNGKSIKPYILENKSKVYLGIDIGSLSTNLVLMDENKEIISKRYLMTAGKPIVAVKQGLSEIKNEVGSSVEVIGACTTGSGRYLIGDIIGADAVKNEIIAHAIASLHVDPLVDTIFEIGGQDSKYISLSNGHIIDFTMNKACAAGTGSFLEEQAEKLKINIKEEFGDMALCASRPVRCNDRCTVFMESEIVYHLQRDEKKENVVAGLSYSIVNNYLNRVVGRKKIGDRIFFQGGVAFNKGVEAAFNIVTGKQVIIPPHHEVMGAYGCAIIAQENANGKSKFKGFDVLNLDYKIKSFNCKSCSNECQINRVTIGKEGKTLYYGSRCEKYEKSEKSRKNQQADEIDYFSIRRDLLHNTYQLNKSPLQIKGKIGMPRIFTMYNEFFPFWKALFGELGYKLILSDETNQQIIYKGVENVVASTCLPVKAAHGHLMNLLDKDIDYLFIPEIRGLKTTNNDLKIAHACPYVIYIASILDATFRLKEKQIKLFAPKVHFNKGYGKLVKELIGIKQGLGIKNNDFKRAVRAASKMQDNFYRSLLAEGEKALSDLKPDEKAIVIVSRPYNGFDNGMNMLIPKKLRKLGVKAIPIDFLSLDEIDLKKDWPNMSWRYGQKILSAAEIIREHPNLYALYITNFACGPDSFLINFFSLAMGNKPFLTIEIDEHSADEGVATRVEAFLDTLEKTEIKKGIANKIRKKLPEKGGNERRKLYVPNMSDHTYIVKSALVSSGVNAETMSVSDEESLKWGRKYTCGKECFPCIMTTGDMCKIINEPSFDPEKSAFFMPTGNGACRFDHYHTLQYAVLNELGYDNVPIYAPNQCYSFYKDFNYINKGFEKILWDGIVSLDYIDKLTRKIRPYELNKGETDAAYKKSREMLCTNIENNGNLNSILLSIVQIFKIIKTDIAEKRPVIGVIGEIFVRTHDFSNNNLIKRLEKYGAEVFMPPTLTEWFLYINYYMKRNLKKDKKYFALFATYIKDLYQKSREHKIKKIFDIFNLEEETSVERVLDYCDPYLVPELEEEVGITVGKALDYINNDVSGIINVMPFTCMPGNIANIMLERIKAEHNNIPVLNINYDGQKENNTETRLETFVFQCKQYNEKQERN